MKKTNWWEKFKKALYEDTHIPEEYAIKVARGNIRTTFALFHVLFAFGVINVIILFISGDSINGSGVANKLYYFGFVVFSFFGITYTAMLRDMDIPNIVVLSEIAVWYQWGFITFLCLFNFYHFGTVMSVFLLYLIIQVCGIVFHNIRPQILSPLMLIVPLIMFKTAISTLGVVVVADALTFVVFLIVLAWFKWHIMRVNFDTEVDLRKTTEAKSSFLASMSHEIRTPINAVLGMDEVIMRETKDTKILGYAQDIQGAGKTLLAIINDILDFSKIESGKMEIVPVSYDISSTLNDIINMINAKIGDKKLELRVDVKPGLPHLLYGDEVRVKQILLNIMTNAVKYTDEGYVELSVNYEKLDNDTILLTYMVEDTGRGMKEEDLIKLFTPFDRIEEAKNTHIEGTGLGMAITKQLLDKMESELIVESEYGVGSKFSFGIKQKVQDWEPIGELFRKRDIENPMDCYEQKFFAPEACALVVDDNPMNLKVFEELLKYTGIQIDAVISGEKCLEYVNRKHYDIIFIDHMMPDMDGIETLERLMKEHRGIEQKIPIIAFTANAISGAREVYLKAGFTDYLTKPVDPNRLEEMMIKHLPRDLIHLPEDSM